MKRTLPASLLFALAISASLAFAPSALAGPPLLCHPFDTAGAPSLPWGTGWNQPQAGYDLAQLPARTEALLTPQTPVIARMETLRRAAIYASRSGDATRRLMSRLDARLAATATADAKALALFDAGYFAETLQEIVRLQDYDMPGIGAVDAPALRAMLATRDGRAHIDQALALRPQDPAMRFAAALVASADQRRGDSTKHAQLARAGVAYDRLLARNIGQIAR